MFMNVLKKKKKSYKINYEWAFSYKCHAPDGRVAWSRIQNGDGTTSFTSMHNRWRIGVTLSPSISLPGITTSYALLKACARCKLVKTDFITSYTAITLRQRFPTLVFFHPTFQDINVHATFPLPRYGDALPPW